MGDLRDIGATLRPQAPQLQSAPENLQVFDTPIDPTLLRLQQQSDNELQLHNIGESLAPRRAYEPAVPLQQSLGQALAPQLPEALRNIGVPHDPAAPSTPLLVHPDDTEQGSSYNERVLTQQRPKNQVYAPAPPPEQPSESLRMTSTARAQEPAAMLPRGDEPQLSRQQIGAAQGVLRGEEQRRQREADELGLKALKAVETAELARQDSVGTQQVGFEVQARGQEMLANAIGQQREANEKQDMLDEGQALLEQDTADAETKRLKSERDTLGKAIAADRRAPNQKAMSVLAIALGSIADGFMQLGGQKGDNVARVSQQIDALIDRDIDEQIRQIGQRRENLTADERAHEAFQRRIGDSKTHRALLKAQRWEEFGHYAQQIAASTNSDAQRSAAESFAAMSDEQARAAEAKGMQAGAQFALDRVRQVQDLGLQFQLGAYAKEPTAYGMRKLTPLARQEDADKAKPIVSGAASLLTMINKLRAQAKQGASLSPTQRGIAEQRVMAVRAQWNKVLGDESAPNEGQIKALADAFKNPKEVNLEDVDALYESLANDLKDSTDAKIRPYGYAVDNMDTQPYRGR